MARKPFRVLSSSSEHSERSYLERGMGGVSHRWRGAFIPQASRLKSRSEYA